MFLQVILDDFFMATLKSLANASSVSLQEDTRVELIGVASLLWGCSFYSNILNDKNNDKVSVILIGVAHLLAITFRNVEMKC